MNPLSVLPSANLRSIPGCTPPMMPTKGLLTENESEWSLFTMMGTPVKSWVQTSSSLPER